jgi:hypothetical protein
MAESESGSEGSTAAPAEEGRRSVEPPGGATSLGWPYLRVYQAVIGLLVIGLVIALTVGQTRVGGAERRAAAERERSSREAAAEIEAARREAERARQELDASSRKALEAQAGALLRLSALPLAWAVRVQLLKKDYREVGVYFGMLVKEPHVRRALLLLGDGVVRISSDQSLEGKRAADLFPGLTLEPDAPRVESREGEVLVIVPVMGLTSRLGTVIVGYAPEVLTPGSGG